MAKECEKNMKGVNRRNSYQYSKDVWECAHNLTENKYPRKPRIKK